MRDDSDSASSDETKACFMCKETIKKAASMCPYCRNLQLSGPIVVLIVVLLIAMVLAFIWAWDVIA
jgi:hypothetical protein